MGEVQQASSTRQSIDNWQTGKSVEECNVHMLSSGLGSDITLIVGKDGMDIHAHRYVLMSRSCVFAALLQQLKDEGDIAIPDVESEDFHDFLMFLYTNKTDVNQNNATKLLYASRKYGVGQLEELCVDYLLQHLSRKNACTVLEAAHKAEHPKLYAKALKVIHRQGQKCLKYPDFLTLSHKCVEDIIKSDNLCADEDVVFEATNDWSEAECDRRGKEVTPRNKRDVMGDILKCIRFTFLDPKFFVDIVGSSGLLADDERLKIFAHNLFPEKDIKPFNKSPRKWQQRTGQVKKSLVYHSRHVESLQSSKISSIKQGDSGSKTSRHTENDQEIQPTTLGLDEDMQNQRTECNYKPDEYDSVHDSYTLVSPQVQLNRTENRFRVQSFGRICNRNDKEIIQFMCDQEIKLCGFLLFGPSDDDSATYYVKCHLNNNNGEIFPGSDIERRFSALREDVVFEVLFQHEIDIIPNMWLTLCLSMEGPPSMYGSEVKGSIVSHGVHFKFEHSDYLDTEQHQIPYLLFKK